LLYEIKEGKTVIQLIVNAFLESKLQKLIIVTGFQARKIKMNIDHLVRSARFPVEFVYNAEYKTGGMSSSIKKGFTAIESAQMVILSPADIPFLPTSIIDSIINIYVGKQPEIIIPTFKGRKGHPILLSSNIFQDVRGISEQKQGLKEIITKYSNQIYFLPTQTPEILRDLDSSEDILKFR
ncbi:MAG: nucleotidyltransferase family protein, partial [Candidatus Hodarchaeales archaeon]